MVYLLWCLVGSPLGLDADPGRGTSVPAAPTRPGSTGHLLWDGKDDATPIVLFQRGLLKQQGGVARWTSYAQRESPLTPTIARRRHEVLAMNRANAALLISEFSRHAFGLGLLMRSQQE